MNYTYRDNKLTQKITRAKVTRGGVIDHWRYWLFYLYSTLHLIYLFKKQQTYLTYVLINLYLMYLKSPVKVSTQKN